MTDIVLVKQDRVPISESDREAARRVLFGAIDGLSEQHRKSWRRIWNWFLTQAAPGEMLEIKTHRERLGWYHRKHMALEQKVFQAQERFEHFRQFRNWLKTGAGFVDWIPGPKGGVMPVPKSISYSELEQDEMERVHRDMVTFLRTEHAVKVLWPNLPDHERELAIEAVLTDFNE
jgi:hypothetical protein